MSTPQNGFTKLGFVKTFVLPALLIFLIPVVSLLFFLHAEQTFDSQVREEYLKQVAVDQTLSADERAAAVELFSKVPFSRMLLDEEFAAGVDPDLRGRYVVFRWMIRLSMISIVSGLAVFLVAGICVLLSLRSPFAQYVSLSAGWHVLRIHGAVQTVIQGILIVALSFWMTALWAGQYYPKLIFLAGAAAVVACGAVIMAIFKRVRPECVVEGEVLTKQDAPAMWRDLQAICDQVGTEPPDQVVVGIDTNFFVTEQPVTVGEQTYHGRTLFVSLSLLEQLQGGEAAAVLAHEMAHFSGNDTLYSRRISPLLIRYSHYLEALGSGGVTLPIFYAMVCFRALYEISLGRLSRQREFRADAIAATCTSPRDLAGALLKIVAYARYRDTVEGEIFKQEEVLEAANISDRIAEGFPAYASSFVSTADIGELATSHPFDSHPPLAERLEAVGVPMDPDVAKAVLSVPPDAAWFHRIHAAEEIQQRQWADFEKRFRDYHEESLPFRFLPENEREREIVVKSFPEVQIVGKSAALTIDFEKVTGEWPEPIRFVDVTAMAVDQGVLVIDHGPGGKQKTRLKLKLFGDRQQEVLDTLSRYYGRSVAAREYQQLKQQGDPSITEG